MCAQNHSTRAHRPMLSTPRHQRGAAARLPVCAAAATELHWSPHCFGSTSSAGSSHFRPREVATENKRKSHENKFATFGGFGLKVCYLFLWFRGSCQHTGTPRTPLLSRSNCSTTPITGLLKVQTLPHKMESVLISPRHARASELSVQVDLMLGSERLEVRRC